MGKKGQGRRGLAEHEKVFKNGKQADQDQQKTNNKAIAMDTPTVKELSDQVDQSVRATGARRATALKPKGQQSAQSRANFGEQCTSYHASPASNYPYVYDKGSTHFFPSYLNVP